MSENTSEAGRIFGATEITEEEAGQDWRALSREELLERTIIALDGAKMEAEEVGDERYIRYVDAVLFPFLEAELKEARGESDSGTTGEIRVLVEEDGITEEEARLRLRDADLWLLYPGARFDEELQGEEGVRLWEEAAKVTQTVAEAINNGPGTIPASPAVTMVAWDAAERAREALRRARQRV